MSYTKTTWNNGRTPAINATNLNHIEQGIYDNDQNIGNIENLETESTNLVAAINEISHSNNYSTTESVVGTWIDGKPLYRVVIDISSITLSAGNTNVATFSSNNVVKKLYAIFGNDTNQYTIPNKNSEFNHIGNNIVFSAGNTWGTNRLIIVIEYTKTTD